MISGLVVYLTTDAQLAEAALQEIQQQPTLELGPQAGLRLPLVLEATTADESQASTDWLISLPGVEHVDVAFVHLDEMPSAEPTEDSQQTVTGRWN